MFHIDIDIDSLHHVYKYLTKKKDFLPCLKNENVQIIFFYKQNELISVYKLGFSKPTTIDGIHTLRKHDK